jgi:hypothetical protein
MITAFKLDVNNHPQEIMKDLGITYQHCTPQSISDEWWFWNCKNIPTILPEYLCILDINPTDCIGWGLSEQKANEIINYKNQ